MKSTPSTFDDRLHWVATVLSLLLLLAACSPRQQGDEEVSHGAQTKISEGDWEVARVNGVSITAKRVSELAKRTKRSPTEVVDRLIAFELLSQEARRRGLGRDVGVREEARKAMVRRYLDLEFEANHRPEDVPESILRDSYAKNRSQFVHPRLLKVAHLLVEARDREATKKQQRDAFKLAGEIHRKAIKTESLEEFRALKDDFDGRRGFKVTEEVIATPVYNGARFASNFINAALEMEEIGQISPPVETSFGSHVIYLIEIREASDQSFEDARSKVLKNEHPFWVRWSFFEVLGDLADQTTVEGFEGQKRRVEEF